jgi:hypothetical protein
MILTHEQRPASLVAGRLQFTHSALMEANTRIWTVIASQRVGTKRRPMTGSAKQSRSHKEDWIDSSGL